MDIKTIGDFPPYRTLDDLRRAAVPRYNFLEDLANAPPIHKEMFRDLIFSEPFFRNSSVEPGKKYLENVEIGSQVPMQAHGLYSDDIMGQETAWRTVKKIRHFRGVIVDGEYGIADYTLKDDGSFEFKRFQRDMGPDTLCRVIPQMSINRLSSSNPDDSQ
ncbi:hypothetical protein HYX03_00540 [Candidatus Woesearchaeota archaeon]|nr:hypothetical protein [Candidatus Woesearchaeota archaeon]